MQEIKVAKKLFLIIACFSLCSGVTGFSWFVGMTGLGLNSHFFGWIEILGFQFSLLNSVFNPLLCIFLFEDIRQAFFRLVVPKLPKTHNIFVRNSESGQQTLSLRVKKIYICR